jgi:hypothetical protein
VFKLPLSAGGAHSAATEPWPLRPAEAHAAAQGQGTWCVPPGQKKPGSQVVHASSAAGEYLPGGQMAQVVSAVAPTALLALPMGQKLQTLDPLVGSNLPAGQLSHADWPV